jgi:hypothetical protein
MTEPLAELTRQAAITGGAAALIAALAPGALSMWRRRRARKAVATWEPWAHELGWSHTSERPHQALIEGHWRSGHASVEAWSLEDDAIPELLIAYAPSLPLPAGLLIAPAGALDRHAIPHGVSRVGTGDHIFDRAFLVLGADVPAVQTLLTPPRRRLLLAARSAKLEWTFKEAAFRLLLPAPHPAPAIASLLDELADLSDRFIAADT